MKSGTGSASVRIMSRKFIERRRYERVPFFADVRLRTVENARPLPARTTDLSLGGLGLVTTTALDPGEHVTVVFSIPGSRTRRMAEIVGRVVSLSADSETNHMSIEFVEPLSLARAPELVNRLQQI
jgi:c-di-GMP-binding flagellar brake protein YcgR